MTAFALAAKAALEDMLAYALIHSRTGILYDNHNLSVKIKN